MAFRMSDFGIPNYDTNVNVLYKNAVAHGESVVCGKEEYLFYHMAGTPLVVVLRFQFREDGETPAQVIAHTFLENDIHWAQDSIREAGDGQAVVLHDGNQLEAEVVNPTAAGAGYTPMLFAESLAFGADAIAEASDAERTAGVMEELNKGVALLAKVTQVQPVVKSGLWLFSVVTLALNEGSIAMPVSRDIMEAQLKDCKKGDYCYVKGMLSLLKDWH